MSLATRCPVCGTIFRLVPDHLRLAQGWVRCGRCEEVFRGAKYLVESDDGPTTTATDTDAAWRLATEDPRAGLDEPRTPPLEAPRDALLDATAADSSAGADSHSQALAAWSPADDAHAWTDPRTHASHDFTWSRAPAPTRAAPAWSRWLWSGVLGLALLTLGLQALHAWRHDIATHMPAARPLLQGWCALAACRVEPLRRIGALSVESSQLTEAGGTVYRLELVIRNRADIALMMPTIDLTLSNAGGAPMARRVIEMTEFGVRARVLAARQTLTVQANLNAGSSEVAGYTIELFHP